MYTVLVVFGAFVLVAMAAGVFCAIRLGVRFALADLPGAFLVLGFPPAVAGAIIRKVPDGGDACASRVWVCGLALTLSVFVFQVYGFYRASVKPAVTARLRLGQRFGASVALAMLGGLALLARG